MFICCSGIKLHIPAVQLSFINLFVKFIKILIPCASFPYRVTADTRSFPNRTRKANLSSKEIQEQLKRFASSMNFVQYIFSWSLS